MTTDGGLTTLAAEGLRHFEVLQPDAVKAVTERFYATHGSSYEQFGDGGRAACRQDLAFHLEFLRPVLEFGLLQPILDYLYWLQDVLAARGVPVDHLAVSLEWLGEFFLSHMDASEGAVIYAALQAARSKVDEPGSARAAPVAAEPWAESAVFEKALLAGRQHEALQVVNGFLDGGRSLVDVERHVMQPALYDVGEKWQANQVSVAQEHMATAIVQAVMTMGLLRSPPPPPIERRALLACVEGNNHVIGLRMVADALQLAGWDVQYLGANVPTTSLVRHAAHWMPDLVALSVSLAPQLPAVKGVISQLDKRLGSARPAVIIGGLAINRFDALARMVGADAFSEDAPGAVVQGTRLVADRR